MAFYTMDRTTDKTATAFAVSAKKDSAPLVFRCSIAVSTDLIYCVPKKHETTFLMISWKQNCEFTKNFGTLITKNVRHRQVFLFSHLIYLVQLLYLGKLSRPKYQQKLNKIMKISQEDVILIKNLYLSKHAVWCMKAVE